MQERLQKIIAAAGIASRRAAEEMILEGEVKVNGTVISQLGAKADPARDHIKVRGKLINPGLAHRKKRYFLINKPRGYLSSLSDPQRRPLVTELIPPTLREGLHLVGRLDFNTEGLIIATNDGELTQFVAQAGAVPKVYAVKVQGAPAEEDIQRLRAGVRLSGSRTAPAEIKLVEHTRKAGNSWYEVTLKEGRNQQIRRMFDLIGHPVVKLRRIRIGNLSDKGLLLGHYREMKSSEVKALFNAYGQKPSKPTSLKDKTKSLKGTTKTLQNEN